MKILLHLLLLFISLGCAAQTVDSTAAKTDSTVIKLKKAKELYEQGLITSKEYEALRQRALELKVEVNLPADHASQVPPNVNKPKHTEPKVRFNIQFVPIGYFDLSSIWHRGAIDSIGPRSIRLARGQYGGLHIELGPAVNRQFHINFATGFEGNTQYINIPVYTDFNVNQLPTMFSPSIHFGGGYYGSHSTNSGTWLNGATAHFGMGFNTRLSKQFSVNIGIDYHFTASLNTIYVPNVNGVNSMPLNTWFYHHQIGLRLAFVVY